MKKFSEFSIFLNFSAKKRKKYTKYASEHVDFVRPDLTKKIINYIMCNKKMKKKVEMCAFFKDKTLCHN